MNLPLQQKFIKKVIDESDSFIKRLHVYFNNGYMMSIIYGVGAYSDKDNNKYEIACYVNNYMTSKFWSDKSEDVLEFVSEGDVMGYIMAIGNSEPLPVEM